LVIDQKAWDEVKLTSDTYKAEEKLYTDQVNCNKAVEARKAATEKC